MTKLILRCVVLILGVSNVIGSETMNKQKYVPYRATSDEISLTNAHAVLHYDRRHEMPADRECASRLEEVFRSAEQMESLIRHMLSKGMVKTNYWNGMYSGSVVVESQKSVYRFIFKSALQQLQQVDVSVFDDKPYGKIKAPSGCSFLFLDYRDAVSSFSSGQGNDKVTLNFYPDGRLKSCGLFIDEQHKYLQWDENGKIVSQPKNEVKE